MSRSWTPCGLKVLLDAQRDGGEDFLGVRNASAQVRRLLAVTGLDRVIHIDPSPVTR